MAESRVVKFLSSPESYSFSVEKVKHIETHISHVFLAGDFAFKLKKPVKFSFLDFSTLKKRKFYCEREVELNKRLSPEIYLGVDFIGDPDELLSFNTGNPVEYLVRMKRLSQEKKMDVLLENNAVSDKDIEELAVKISDFHSKAGVVKDGLFGKPEKVWNDIENILIVKDVVEEKLSMGPVLDSVLEKSRAFIDSNNSLFAERIKSGKIKVCHGDLHARNIFIENSVHVFDCIEFNDDFVNIDTASDIAFLLMDLEFRGRKDLADKFLKKYIFLSGDKQALELIPVYKCYRANVRAKVAGLRAMQVEGTEEKEALEECKKYLLLAEEYAGKL